MPADCDILKKKNQNSTGRSATFFYYKQGTGWCQRKGGGISMKAKLLRWGLLLCCAGFLLFGLGLYFGRTTGGTVLYQRPAAASSVAAEAPEAPEEPAAPEETETEPEGMASPRQPEYRRRGSPGIPARDRTGPRPADHRLPHGQRPLPDDGGDSGRPRHRRGDLRKDQRQHNSGVRKNEDFSGG